MPVGCASKSELPVVLRAVSDTGRGSLGSTKRAATFLLGTTLWLPNELTVAVLVASYIAIEIQIRIAEAYLGSAHGEEDRHYRRGSAGGFSATPLRKRAADRGLSTLFLRDKIPQVCNAETTSTRYSTRR